METLGKFDLVISVTCKFQLFKKISYIEPPGSLIDCWFGIDIAFKVDIITFLNFIGI